MCVWIEESWCGLKRCSSVGAGLEGWWPPTPMCPELCIAPDELLSLTSVWSSDLDMYQLFSWGYSSFDALTPVQSESQLIRMYPFTATLCAKSKNRNKLVSSLQGERINRFFHCQLKEFCKSFTLIAVMIVEREKHVNLQDSEYATP